MRYEAKHSYFKRLAKNAYNFKNIAKTLAKRHQHLMCYYLNSPGEGHGFLDEVTTTGRGQCSYSSKVHYVSVALVRCNNMVTTSFSFLHSNTSYRCGHPTVPA